MLRGFTLANMQKKHLTLIAATAAILLLILLFTASKGCTCREEAQTDTTLLVLTQIRECSRIYTTQVEVHKIVTHNDDYNIELSAMAKLSAKLPLGKRKIAMPVTATLKAYVDLSQLSPDNVHRSGEEVEIVLPDPTIILTSSKIEHDNTVTVVPWLRNNFRNEELASYARQGRADIIKSIPERNIIPTARANAARVIIPLLTQMGYKEENITVTFRKQFTAGEITRLIVTD